jgi:hypothetical protein
MKMVKGRLYEFHSYEDSLKEARAEAKVLRISGKKVKIIPWKFSNMKEKVYQVYIGV